MLIFRVVPVYIEFSEKYIFLSTPGVYFKSTATPGAAEGLQRLTHAISKSTAAPAGWGSNLNSTAFELSLGFMSAAAWVTSARWESAYRGKQQKCEEE